MALRLNNISQKDIIFILILLLIVGVITCTTSYKSEKLICNLEKHSCFVERYTYYFTKNTVFLINTDDIEDVVVKKKTESVRRNRRYSSLKIYSPAFLKNNGFEEDIFNGKYRKYSEAEAKVEEIKRKLDSGANIIEISR